MLLSERMVRNPDKLGVTEDAKSVKGFQFLWESTPSSVYDWLLEQVKLSEAQAFINGLKGKELEYRRTLVGKEATIRVLERQLKEKEHNDTKERD